MRLIDAEILFNKVGEIKPRNKEHYKAIGEFMNMITNSPTIESTTTATSADEPVVINYPIITCDNTVSREAVIEWLKAKDIIKMSWQEENARKELSELPSVQPSRKGHWIEERNDYGEIQGWHCDKCYEDSGFTTDCKWGFCPNCGADMRGDTDANS